MSDVRGVLRSSAPDDSGATAGILRRFVGGHWFELFAVFILGAALLSSVYGPFHQPAGEIGVPGHDSFYHVKMAELLPEHGLPDRFPWLRFVYFRDQGEEFVSHHYGFHLLLWPFVAASKAWTGDALPGGRWAMSFLFGLNAALFDWLLMRSGVRGRWFWLLLALCLPAHFYTRQAYVRAIAPSLTGLLLLVMALRRGQGGAWAAIVIALSVHVYLGSVMFAPLVVGLYALACLAAPREERTWPWGLVLWCAAGWAAGVSLHPYAGGMAEFLRLQVLGTGLSPEVAVGSEWRPYENVWWFGQFVATPMAVWMAAMLLRMRWGPTIDRWTMFLLLWSLALLVLVLKARRFMEYWPVFCLLASAVTAAPVVNEAIAGIHAWSVRRGVWPRRAVTWGPVALATLAGAAIVTWSPLWSDVRGGGRCKYDLAAVRAAMDYLRSNSGPGEVVFTDDWDIFPVYFYYNDHNFYVVGLDPEFTHARRPDLWQRYVRVTRGQTPATDEVTMETASGGKETLSLDIRLTDIREHFGAAWVVVDQDHGALFDDLRAAPGFASLVYPAEPVEARRAPYRIFRVPAEAEGAGGGERIPDDRNGGGLASEAEGS